jgi:hypothetical protein
MATQIVPAPVSAERTTAPLPPLAAAARAAEAAQIAGFRIMRSTEVAPGWWGQPREVGETGSAAVADSFCREQNAVTMDPNRPKRIMYSADPIYADGPAAEAPPTAPLSPAAVDALRKLELALTTPDAATVAKVGHAFGFRAGWKPNPHLGETATYLTVWSQHELNDLYLRVGGTVTLRQVERSTSDEMLWWTATEITLTVEVPGVGPVEIVTDVEDDPEHGYRTDLPVVAVARYEAASRHCQAASAVADFDGCLAAQDEMRMCRCQLEAAGRLDLIEAA